MSKIYFIPAVIALAACGGSATSGEAGDVAEAGSAAASYVVDSTSNVAWKAGKLFSADGHSGSFGVSAGELSMENGNITAGNFTIDMTKITTDLTPETGADKLIGHLSADDFFNVAKFPKASFAITACEAKADGANTHLITGNLTLRDSTRSVTIPAAVKVEGDKVTATGTAKINRLDWGINYDKDNQSATETTIGSFKNGVVNKDVEITINLSATKK